jgi:hypothetical protein
MRLKTPCHGRMDDIALDRDFLDFPISSPDNLGQR